jgi:uncharacterized protein
LIDCAVRHEWRSIDDLRPFLPREGRNATDYARDSLPALSEGFATPGTIDAGKADFDAVERNILQAAGDTKAVLIYGQALNLAGMRDGYLAQQLASAANDWTAEEWLARDERLAGSILVATQLPDTAADEVRRCAGNPQMCQVILAGNGIGKPFGHPVYHAIYRAAFEVGRPIAIHAGAAGGLNPAPAGGATINLFTEYHALAAQGLMTHLLSFIAHGVFEKFPGLRLMLLGAGVAWLPAFLWRVDTDFKGVRREVPWVKRLPSDYVRDFVVVGTYPLDGPQGTDGMRKLLDMLPSPTTVVYASGYPSWDRDHAGAVLERVPEEWREEVFSRAAARHFGGGFAGRVDAAPGARREE